MSEKPLEKHTHIAISISEYEDFEALEKRVQELEEHLQMSNQYVKKEREINTQLKKQNKCYREHLDLIKQKSSCTMAVAHATKALECEE